MKERLRIAFFGSSRASVDWNGGAAQCRGIVRALHDRGHRITCYEPDADGRPDHRDLPDPPGAPVVAYRPSEEGASRAVDEARLADVVVKAGGVGVLDGFLERAVAALRAPGRLAVFWDLDAPATLDRMAADPEDPFRALVPAYDRILATGGGPAACEAYLRLGARDCTPVHGALDPALHHPAPPDPRFEADLVFLGTRMPDLERRVDEYFLRTAAALRGCTFLLGGEGWDTKPLPRNVRWLGHVTPRDHNALHSTPRACLNLSRESRGLYGQPPSPRVFEAAGAEACLITDTWEGIGAFLEPGREILVAEGPGQVVEHLLHLDPVRSRALGAAAARRVRSEHTYAHRALQLETLLEDALGAPSGVPVPPRRQGQSRTRGLPLETEPQLPEPHGLAPRTR